MFGKGESFSEGSNADELWLRPHELRRRNRMPIKTTSVPQGVFGRLSQFFCYLLFVCVVCSLGLVFYGVIYQRPLDEDAPGLSSYCPVMGWMVDLGREVRNPVDEVETKPAKPSFGVADSGVPERCVSKEKPLSKRVVLPSMKTLYDGRNIPKKRIGE